MLPPHLGSLISMALLICALGHSLGTATSTILWICPGFDYLYESENPAAQQLTVEIPPSTAAALEHMQFVRVHIDVADPKYSSYLFNIPMTVFLSRESTSATFDIYTINNDVPGPKDVGFTITTSSSSKDYAASYHLPVAIIDDDSPAPMIVPLSSGTDLAEGAAWRYRFRFDAPPRARVTVVPRLHWSPPPWHAACLNDNRNHTVANLTVPQVVVEPREASFSVSQWYTGIAFTIRSEADPFFLGFDKLYLMHEITSIDYEVNEKPHQPQVLNYVENELPRVVRVESGIIEFSEQDGTVVIPLVLLATPQTPITVECQVSPLEGVPPLSCEHPDWDYFEDGRRNFELLLSTTKDDLASGTVTYVVTVVVKGDVHFAKDSEASPLTFEVVRQDRDEPGIKVEHQPVLSLEPSEFSVATSSNSTIRFLSAPGSPTYMVVSLSTELCVWCHGEFIDPALSISIEFCCENGSPGGTTKVAPAIRTTVSSRITMEVPMGYRPTGLSVGAGEPEVSITNTAISLRVRRANYTLDHAFVVTTTSSDETYDAYVVDVPVPVEEYFGPVIQVHHVSDKAKASARVEVTIESSPRMSLSTFISAGIFSVGCRRSLVTCDPCWNLPDEHTVAAEGLISHVSHKQLFFQGVSTERFSFTVTGNDSTAGITSYVLLKFSGGSYPLKSFSGLALKSPQLGRGIPIGCDFPVEWDSAFLAVPLHSLVEVGHNDDSLNVKEWHEQVCQIGTLCNLRVPSLPGVSSALSVSPSTWSMRLQLPYSFDPTLLEGVLSLVLHEDSEHQPATFGPTPPAYNKSSLAYNGNLGGLFGQRLPYYIDHDIFIDMFIRRGEELSHKRLPISLQDSLQVARSTGIVRFMFYPVEASIAEGLTVAQAAEQLPSPLPELVYREGENQTFLVLVRFDFPADSYVSLTIEFEPIEILSTEHSLTDRVVEWFEALQQFWVWPATHSYLVAPGAAGDVALFQLQLAYNPEIEPSAVFAPRIRAHSSDLRYDGPVAVPVAGFPGSIEVRDVGTPGLQISPNTSFLIREGGSNISMRLTMNTKPTHAVRVVFVVQPVEATVEPFQWTVFPDEWYPGASYPITVEAVDDAEDEEGEEPISLSFLSLSDDIIYDAFPNTPISGVVVDNDGVGVAVDPVSLTLTGFEGGFVFYSLSLLSQPKHPVSIKAEIVAPPFTTVSIAFDELLFPANGEALEPQQIYVQS